MNEKDCEGDHVISIECLKRETRSLSQYLPATGEATREQRHGLGHGDLVTFFFLLIFIFPYPICMYTFWKLFTIKPFFLLYFCSLNLIISLITELEKGKKFTKKKLFYIYIPSFCKLSHN